MHYNFDEIIERDNTNSVKLELRKMLFGTNDVIPMWVADMDFKTPDFIVSALKERLTHEIFGYSLIPDSCKKSVVKWFSKRHNWKINKSWITFTAGVVPSINMAIMAFSEPGDKIIVQPPVYFPFFSAIKNNNRQLVSNPLKLINGRYYFDFDDLKQKIDKQVKLLLLCNPHNPGGMVWYKDELDELGKICLENNILIVSDEIHCDLVFKDYKYTPIAKVSEDISNISITLSAPHKTFNMAGLATSFAIIPNEKLYEKYKNLLETFNIAQANLIGVIALETAYTYGEKWLDQLLNYLENNLKFIENYLWEQIPLIRLIKPEATFLVWLDFNKLGMTNRELRQLLVKEAGLGLSNGIMFGHEGAGFQRMNFAVPFSKLQEALTLLKEALDKYNLQFYL